jgi:hypothetical protein
MEISDPDQKEELSSKEEEDSQLAKIDISQPKSRLEVEIIRQKGAHSLV